MYNIKQTNLSIMVHDLKSSIDFYMDILGFKVLKQYGHYYCQVYAPGIIIGLHPSAQKNSPSDIMSVGFTVDDFEGAKSHLEKMAIQFTERKEQGGEFVHFKDPDGTALYFIKPK